VTGLAPLEVLEAPLDALPDSDTLVGAAVRWHFDPRTAAPFWLEQAASLPFDPVTEITCVADLARFPDVSAALRTRDDLVRRCVAEPTIRAVHLGPTPTTDHDAARPHDGHLAEFVMTAKTVTGAGVRVWATVSWA
jgi:hypothetical protein